MNSTACMVMILLDMSRRDNVAPSNPFQSPIFELNNDKVKNCKSCMYSDSTRTNNIGEIRCKKFHTYISPISYCDYFDTEANAKLKEMLLGVMQNE